MAWQALDPAAKAYVYSYFVPEFGETANCLALGYLDGLAVVSPGPGFAAADYDFLETIAPVRALLVPNSGHSLGVEEWRRRFPAAKIYAPPEALGDLEKKGVAGVESISGLKRDPLLIVKAAPGTLVGSLLVSSRRGARAVYYLDELVINLPGLPKAWLSKLYFWLAGNGAGIRLNKVYLLMLVKGKAELGAAYADMFPAKGILVPSHGAVLDSPEMIRCAENLVTAWRRENKARAH